MMVCIGRFDGPSAFGCSGLSTKPEPRLLNSTPVFSVQMPVPNDENSELIRIDHRNRKRFF